MALDDFFEQGSDNVLLWIHNYRVLVELQRPSQEWSERKKKPTTTGNTNKPLKEYRYVSWRWLITHDGT